MGGEGRAGTSPPECAPAVTGIHREKGLGPVGREPTHPRLEGERFPHLLVESASRNRRWWHSIE